MIKKFYTVLIFILITSSAKCDVIFFPYQYSLINYSIEFVYSYELAKKVKSSTVLWGGAGAVGSFFYLDEPAAGLEIAIERRRYFKAEQYKGFFISGYLGAAYMTDFKYTHDLGLVPGFKFNYKAQLSKNLVMEPYIGLSVPITIDMNYKDFYFPFPMATIGIRLGITSLKK